MARSATVKLKGSKQIKAKVPKANPSVFTNTYQYPKTAKAVMGANLFQEEANTSGYPLATPGANLGAANGQLRAKVQRAMPQLSAKQEVERMEMMMGPDMGDNSLTADAIHLSTLRGSPDGRIVERNAPLAPVESIIKKKSRVKRK